LHVFAVRYSLRHIRRDVTHRLAAALYLRLLGVSYLAAFASFWSQIDGLIGSSGILPAEETMRYAARVTRGGLDGFLAFPTLTWIDASDGSLSLICLSGMGLSLVLIAGSTSRLLLAGLLVLYLSLVTAGRDFMSFQWDNLMLEAGLLAILLAPPIAIPRLSKLPAPFWIGLALHRVLLFRLIFSSGWAKFTSGDEAWTNLEALRHHYETQPLPTFIGWWAHQLPSWFQSASVAGVFVLQCLAPFLIFGHRPLRRVALVAIAGLQILIALTGNYGFFNLLTIALAMLLADDDLLRRLMPRSLAARALEPEPDRAAWRSKLDLGLVAPLAVGLVISAAFQISRTLDLEPSSAAKTWLRAISPFRMVNTYGLFAVMTTERPEIIIEGSEDGVTWVPYELPYKPGALDVAPGFVAPHMPRLDWQLWFAALSGARAEHWFARLMAHLKNGTPSVLALFERDPFEGRRPAHLRAVLYRYRFTTIDERRATGNWWKRTAIEPR
jgi:lipase maturation factor 1